MAQILVNHLIFLLPHQLLHHLHIRRKPVYRTQFLPIQPSCVFMLLQHQMTRTDRAQKAVHCEVESWIITFHCSEEGIDTDFRIQFFTYLAFQGFLPALACLYLSTGKLLVVLKLTIAALGGKILSFTTNYCCYNFYLLHLNM